MIREATLDDIPAILKLSYEVHAKTHYRTIPIDERHYTHTLRLMIQSKKHLVLMAEEHKKPVGFLLGMVQQLFFSKVLYATDLMIYVRPKSKLSGVQMVTRFLNWARSRPGVGEIVLGVSSDIVDEARVGALYERCGLERMGGLYIQNLRQEKAA